MKLQDAVTAIERIGDQTADEDRSAEEVAPFGNPDQADNQDADDGDESGRMTGPEPGTELAVGYHLPGLAILIAARNHLIERVATERSVGFHDRTLPS